MRSADPGPPAISSNYRSIPTLAELCRAWRLPQEQTILRFEWLQLRGRSVWARQNKGGHSQTLRQPLGTTGSHFACPHLDSELHRIPRHSLYTLGYRRPGSKTESYSAQSDHIVSRPSKLANWTTQNRAESNLVISQSLVSYFFFWPMAAGFLQGC